MSELTHPSPETLSALHDGELAAAERGAVERHVADCAACATALARLRRASSLLAALPRESADDDLVRAVAARAVAGASSRRPPKWLLMSIPLVAASSVVALSFFVLQHAKDELAAESVPVAMRESVPPPPRAPSPPADERKNFEERADMDERARGGFMADGPAEMAQAQAKPDADANAPTFDALAPSGSAASAKAAGATPGAKLAAKEAAPPAAPAVDDAGDGGVVGGVVGGVIGGTLGEAKTEEQADAGFAANDVAVAGDEVDADRDLDEAKKSKDESPAQPAEARGERAAALARDQEASRAAREDAHAAAEAESAELAQRYAPEPPASVTAESKRRTAPGTPAPTLGADIKQQPVTASTPIEITAEVVPPTLVKRVEAITPAAIVVTKAEEVVLSLIVDEHGVPRVESVLRSVAGLDQAAIDAVRQWRYTPARFQEHPQAVRLRARVQFLPPVR